MDFSTDTDADLLGYMGMGEPEHARAAWGEFYTRNVEYLYALTCRCYGEQLGGEQGAEDLVADTFQKVFHWAGKHATEAGALDGFQGGSPEHVRRRVRGWLGKIAENHFKELLRGTEREPGELEAPENHSSPEPLQEATPEAKERLARLEASLQGLSSEDQEALRVCQPWYDDDTGTYTFGPGEAEELASSLGITVDTLRQRRYRARKRLEKAMQPESSAPARTGGRR